MLQSTSDCLMKVKTPVQTHHVSVSVSQTFPVYLTPHSTNMFFKQTKRSSLVGFPLGFQLIAILMEESSDRNS